MDLAVTLLAVFAAVILVGWAFRQLATGGGKPGDDQDRGYV